MKYFVIFDCEWLTDEGAWKRSNCGPHDPDPQIVQIGAIKARIDEDLSIAEEFNCLILPKQRNGDYWRLPKYFTDLTDISEEALIQDGREIDIVIRDFSHFVGTDLPIWSWGKDELAIAKSCYLSGINFPIPAKRFSNISKVFLQSGMATDDILNTNSGSLSQFFGVQIDNHKQHNAIHDVRSIHAALKYLYKNNLIEKSWLHTPLF